MNKPVTLLVCLSPSVPHEAINELSFHGIVSVITEVLNVRLIAKEGQMKAFVQVTNQIAADLVISKLHCQLLNLGKAKVFVSNKTMVNYTKSLDQVLQNQTTELQVKAQKSCEEEDLFGSYKYCRNTGNDEVYSKEQFLEESGRNQLAPNREVTTSLLVKNSNQVFINKERGLEYQNTKSSQGNFLSPLDRTASKGKTDLVHCSIRITHSDMRELENKKVSKLFRRYGRLVDINFDYECAAWTLTYSTHKDVLKIYKASQKNKLFGYKICYNDDNVPVYNNRNKFINRQVENNKTKVHYLSYTEEQEKSREDENVVLTIDVYNGYITIGELCRIIAKVYVPLELLQCYNLKEDSYFYNARFATYEEAAEVLFVLNSIQHTDYSFNAMFTKY